MPDPDCAWSHGGFDIGYATAPVASAQGGGPRAASWTPMGTLMWSNDFGGLAGGNIHQGIIEFPQGSGEW